MLLKCKESTDVDYRTWLHLSSGIPWSTSTDTHQIVYVWNFSRREILEKMPLGMCVKFLLSHIFAISRTIQEDV